MKQLAGKVVNLKTNKTVTVLVERLWQHPLYKKRMRKSKKFLVHNEIEGLQLGTKVIIEGCRPISKRKNFKVLRIVK
jgi:small subunit ribosomal protein S17